MARWLLLSVALQDSQPVSACVGTGRQDGRLQRVAEAQGFYLPGVAPTEYLDASQQHNMFLGEFSKARFGRGRKSTPLGRGVRGFLAGSIE